jgi:hypothetical protein
MVAMGGEVIFRQAAPLYMDTINAKKKERPARN